MVTRRIAAEHNVNRAVRALLQISKRVEDVKIALLIKFQGPDRAYARTAKLEYNRQRVLGQNVNSVIQVSSLQETDFAVCVLLVPLRVNRELLFVTCASVDTNQETQPLKANLGAKAVHRDRFLLTGLNAFSAR